MEESERQSDNPHYYLRKRARITTSYDVQETRDYDPVLKRKNPIMGIPTELLQKIFSFISNDELANVVRLTNRRFRVVVQLQLNLNFMKLESRLRRTRQALLDCNGFNTSDSEVRCLCKLLNVIDVLMFYHSLIVSTIWRYISVRMPPSNTCMYAGKVLDLYDVVLKDFRRGFQPEQTYMANLFRDYHLKTICAKAKIFILHFDNKTEPSMPGYGFMTGCKLLDILDTATDASRTVVSREVTGDVLTLQVNYFFANAWFVAFDASETSATSWKDQQRLMYKRLKRIVIRHSEMAMDSNQYRRELSERSNADSQVRRPINSVYTGYGEARKTIFFYGTMNEGAYASKFPAENNVPAVDGQPYGPYLGLNITVNVRCPIQLAPLAVLEELERGDPEIRTRFFPRSRRRVAGVLEIKVDFHCRAARYARLPTDYRYYVKRKRF